MHFTVFGSTGFIGSNLTTALTETGHSCYCPKRGDKSVFSKPLGHVIYGAGVLSGHEKRALDCIEAHVSGAAILLEQATFESFLYLSTAKLYMYGKGGQEEQPLNIHPENQTDIYCLSKLLGESACYATKNPTVRVVRLSSVIGKNFDAATFVYAIVNDAIRHGKIVLTSAVSSERDYVKIDDVVRILPQITQTGSHRLYNVASGNQVSNGDIVEAISRQMPCDLSVLPGAPCVKWPPISIKRVQGEFGFRPSHPLIGFGTLVAERKEILRDQLA